MKKFLLIVAFIFLFTMNTFAYIWIEQEGSWYVFDETTSENVKDILLDVGDNVYYLDSDGKLVVGWWKNKDTEKIYFFDNNFDRNYGGMVFGLHMIDGYMRYFGADGSLAVSAGEGNFLNVYGDYWVDFKGNLYLNNELVRNTSIEKSEFYSNPAYYTDENLNNYYLANYDLAIDPVVDLAKNGPAITDYEKDKLSTGSNKSSASRTSGGTDYYVDSNGHVVVQEQKVAISQEELYGPRKSK